MSELLLSFGLGKAKSFLWTITRDRVNVYELPAETEIGKQARAFSHAVRYARDPSNAGPLSQRAAFWQAWTPTRGISRTGLSQGMAYC